MGRKSKSGMSSGAGNPSASSAGGGSFMSNQQNMEDYAVAVGMFDRDFMRTEEGKQALKEFMEGEKEAGLTERDMKRAIKDTGSASGKIFKASEVPSRVQSYTTTGTGVSGNWESRRYVTRKGDAIKEVTKYESGRKTTTTVMENNPKYPQYNRTRAQFESELAKMAKAEIRTGSKVTGIDDKKKGNR